jgi:hypothetical protein
MTLLQPDLQKGVWAPAANSTPEERLSSRRKLARELADRHGCPIGDIDHGEQHYADRMAYLVWAAVKLPDHGAKWTFFVPPEFPAMLPQQALAANPSVDTRGG